MKRGSISIFMIVLFCLIMAAAVHAQGPVPIKIPNYINYQGKLVENPDDPNRAFIAANGIYTMTFRIYDAEETLLWEETHLEVDVKIGIFNVILGEVNPLYLNFEQDYWLALEVYPDYEMFPRQRIVSTGYSFMSQESYSLNGYESSSEPGDDMLLALDENAEFPNSVLKMGEGRGLDADMVDGVHASSTLDEDKLVVWSAISEEIDNRVTNHTNANGHLSVDEKTDLTDGGPTTLHYHAIQACTSGYSIRQINPDGSVLCEPDNVNDAVSDPGGTYNNMNVGYASRAGDAQTLNGKHANELGGISFDDLCAEFGNSILGSPISINVIGDCGKQCQSHEEARCRDWGGNYIYGEVWGGGGPGITYPGRCECLRVWGVNTNRCGTNFNIGGRVERLFHRIHNTKIW